RCDLCRGSSTAGPSARESWMAITTTEGNPDDCTQCRARVKFLIDECLSPELVLLAHERGHGVSTHVIWLGLRSRKDWAIVRELSMTVTCSSPTTRRISLHCSA